MAHRAQRVNESVRREKHPLHVPAVEPILAQLAGAQVFTKLDADLYEWKQHMYLMIIDYYSRYIEIAHLSGTTADEVIRHTKSIFVRHGIPEQVISDNGPQFASEAYRKFARDFHFEHVTSSPYFPQSNGEAERGGEICRDN